MVASLALALVEDDTTGNCQLVKRGPNNNTARDDVAAALVLTAGAVDWATKRRGLLACTWFEEPPSQGPARPEEEAVAAQNPTPGKQALCKVRRERLSGRPYQAASQQRRTVGPNKPSMSLPRLPSHKVSGEWSEQHEPARKAWRALVDELTIAERGGR